MKIGIVYATNRGNATVRLAKWLEITLRENGFDVISGKPEGFNRFGCDGFIIGSAVYGGTVKDAGIQPFLDSNRDWLRGKPVALFIVCLGINDAEPIFGEMEKMLSQPPISKKVFKGYMKFKGKFEKTQKRIAEEWAHGIAEALNSV